ncbi:plastocyanin [Paenibacillus castaneae]|nr:plastocyanin/azurin family copper-binding protein [Paenibacillus castaneae]NIK79705.1 plastocyanin [Paenibacillus castaneae]
MTATHNTLDMTAAPISSDAADESAHDDGNGKGKTPSPSPMDAASPVQKPAATEKVTEVQPEATASQPKSTPKTPVKTEEPIKDKGQPSVAVTVHTVEITNFAFSPEKLEISQGDIVTFINKDEVKHSATADNGQFDTTLLAQDESKKVTFSDAGEFGYYCIPHPGMRGSIVVKEK